VTEPLSFEKSRPTLPAPRLPEAGVRASDQLPEELRRRRPPPRPPRRAPAIMRANSPRAAMNY
jgi:hypothetical protein